MFVFHNPIMCLPDYSSPVIMLKCVNQKQPCSCFKTPRWEKNTCNHSHWCLFQMPLKGHSAQHELPKHLLNSAPLCGFVTSSFSLPFFLIFTPSPSFLHVSRLLLCINAGSAPEDKSRWIADGQCSETKRRCSTFTLLLFNCLFNSTEVNGSVCYTAPLLLYLVWSWIDTRQ